MWRASDTPGGGADADAARLVAAGAPVVKPPTSQPWGRRSAWFRDPDGNVVNLYQDLGEAS